MTHEQTQKRLEDLSIELIERAAALDRLAGQLELKMIEVNAREKQVAMRERDVLRASDELLAMRSRLMRKGEPDHGRFTQ